MFIDARRLPGSTEIEADICIVGAGAAGITLARELMGHGLRICLLESGGLRREEETQALYDGDVVGLPYDLSGTRSRFFGGSSNCWGGFCRPFEPYHFEKRPWVPDSGWPFGFDELLPWYGRAHAICGLDPTAYEPGRSLSAVQGRDLRQLPLGGGRLVTSIAQLNKKRRRLGSVYRGDLRAATDVDVYLYANALELVPSASGSGIERLRVRALGCEPFAVRAQTFVVACGAIENARLLLASNGVEHCGVGNRHDRVGRYFMEHPTLAVSEIDVPPEQRPALLAYIDRFALMRLPVCAEVNVPFSVQRRERLLDSAMHVELVLEGENSPSTAAAKSVFGDVWRGCMPREPWQRLGALLGSPIDGLKFACGLFTCADSLVQSRRIVVSTEQCPDPGSRVTLGHERDALGLPKVRLDWRLNEFDRRTMRRTTEILVEDLRRAGVVGAARNLLDTVEAQTPRWNWHHIGTTRMHEDPRKGVVDAQCRVHGLDNLYLAGSSVFPTAGNHTPTLTIIALAARLAERVRLDLVRKHVPEAGTRPAGRTPFAAAAFEGLGGASGSGRLAGA